MLSYNQLQEFAQRSVPNLLFITISGAHLYGFESTDSDIDLRGAYLAPLQEVLSLKRYKETIEAREILDNTEVELVAHDLTKYLRLLIKPNGYVLEQICSPLIVMTSPEHQTLRDLATAGLSKGLYKHYRGFALGQLRELQKSDVPPVKTLLYTYRVLMTGIVIMRHNKVEANLRNLCGICGYNLDSLIEQKQYEKIGFTGDITQHYEAIDRLFYDLERAWQESTLPENVPNYDEVSNFLIQSRMTGANGNK